METKSQRKFHRVDDLLPFTYRRITTDDYELLKKKYDSGTLCELGACAPPSSLVEIISELEQESALREILVTITRYLAAIDMKIDILKNTIVGSEKGSLFTQEPRKINISGSGARFMAEGSFHVNDIVEMKILLPGLPMLVIPALCEVRHVDTTNVSGTVEVAVHYTAISEEHRDQLTKYIIKMERALLRTRAEKNISSANVGSIE